MHSDQPALSRMVPGIERTSERVEPTDRTFGSLAFMPTPLLYEVKFVVVRFCERLISWDAVSELPME